MNCRHSVFYQAACYRVVSRHGGTGAQRIVIVFKLHAGCLGSYASEKRARLCRAYRLVEESEDQVELLYSIRDVYRLHEIGPLRDAVVERIRLFAPELLPVPDPSMPFCCQALSHVRRVYMKRVRDDERNKRRRIKR